jgi:N-hydroxyarylamine O-acetyltransferase
MRLDDGVSRRLVGDELTVEYASGGLERSRIPAKNLEVTLRELGVVLDPEELVALRSTWER